MSINIGPGIALGAGVKIDPVYSPVTAGLVQHLDALDYTGSGTTWTAQVGSNATLVNSPTWNSSVGYFNFVPTSLQYASVPNIGDLSNWTVECWFQTTDSLATKEATAAVTTVYDDGAGTNYGVINYCLGNNSGGGSNPNIQAGYFNGAWHETSGFTPTVGTWYQMTGTFNGTNIGLYVNGALNNSVAGGGSSTANGAPIRIARRWDGPENQIHYFPGYIAIVKIYNTALSGTQVLQNYLATKARFGL